MLAGSETTAAGKQIPFLQQNSRLIKAVVKEVDYKINVNTLIREQADGEIKLNEIVKVTPANGTAFGL